MMSVQQVTFIKRYQILASLTAVLHATTAPMPFSIIICVSFTVGFFFINLFVGRKSNLEQSHSLNYILSSATPKCLHWRYRFSIEVVKTWCKVLRHCRKSLTLSVLEPNFEGLCKQFGSRWDATERGVSSGSKLFAILIVVLEKNRRKC